MLDPKPAPVATPETKPDPPHAEPGILTCKEDWSFDACAEHCDSDPASREHGDANRAAEFAEIRTGRSGQRTAWLASHHRPTPSVADDREASGHDVTKKREWFRYEVPFPMHDSA